MEDGMWKYMVVGGMALMLTQANGANLGTKDSKMSQISFVSSAKLHDRVTVSDISIGQTAACDANGWVNALNLTLANGEVYALPASSVAQSGYGNLIEAYNFLNSGKAKLVRVAYASQSGCASFFTIFDSYNQ
jgi:hypothetical protein